MQGFGVSPRSYPRTNGATTARRKPAGTSVHAPRPVEPDAHEGKVSAARGIPNQLDHGIRLAAISASAGPAGTRQAPAETRQSAQSHHASEASGLCAAFGSAG